MRSLGEWIPEPLESHVGEILEIGGGEFEDAVALQSECQTEVDEATEGEARMSRLAPHVIHDLGGFNQCPGPILAISLNDCRGLRSVERAGEDFFITELEVKLHQHEFAHRHVPSGGQGLEKVRCPGLPGRGLVCRVHGEVGVEGEHGSDRFSVMAESRPFVLRRERSAEVKGLGQAPRFWVGSAGGVVADDFLQSSANHFCEAHFVLRSDPFGFAEKRIRNLHLGFHHDGNLPAEGRNVNVISLMIRGRAAAIVDEVSAAVRRWPEFAAQAGLSDEWREKIQKAHRLSFPKA